MYNGKTISIALATYNGEDYIAEALRGFLDDPIVDEIVVSDDNSTDGTKAIVGSFEDPRIVFVTNDGARGQFRNFNNALAHTTGDYIQLFSHDDRILPGFIDSQVRTFDLDSEIGLVYSSCQRINPDGEIVGKIDDDGTPVIIDFPMYLKLVMRHVFLPPSISAMMFRREVLDLGIRFNDDFVVSGDVEFGNRIAEKFKFARNRTLFLQVRAHAGSVTMSSTAPLAYIIEERQTIEFNRLHMPPADFEAALKQRLHDRGITHGKILLRMLSRGQFKSFARAYSHLRPVHSPLVCMALGLRDRFVPGVRTP